MKSSQDTFETRKRSFISVFSICMTPPLNKPCLFSYVSTFSGHQGLKSYVSLCENSPNSEFFWSVFSRIWTEYGDIRDISPYLNAGKYGAEKLRIRTFFTQSKVLCATDIFYVVILLEDSLPTSFNW